MKEINLLGLRATDRVTGQSGVITSVCYDLYGCVQAVLNPGKGSDGKLGDCLWYDVSRLDVETAPRVMPVPNFGQKPAGIPLASVVGPESKPVPR